MSIDLKSSKVISQRLEISGDGVAAVLRSHFKAAGNDHIKVPADARVYVQVPLGGDYSGTDLDINKTTKLIVEWTEKE